ncbi:DUF4232 domain-containing protein [Streptomyces sp. NPDC008313]|uniref:DUF4232 domain-containing protein n=1 Tax=Streptomyces sp. NPDC008313 TaxID=3364826 RepID=UPI0036ED1177
MRATPAHLATTAVAVLATALALTSCDDSGDGGEAAGGGKDAKQSAVTACAAGHVAVRVGPGNAAPAAGDTGNIPVTVTNSGSADCTLKGFPRTELTGDGTAWTVARQPGAHAETVTLKPDEAASFTLTYVRGTAGGTGDSVVVKTLKVALPGADGGSETSPWTYGEVALKSKDTVDASVSPFRTAGD